MSITQTYTATQARQNFFKILDEVHKTGKPAVVKKDNTKHFIISFRKPEKRDISKILDEMGEIGLPILPMKKMKKIFESSHDIRL